MGVEETIKKCPSLTDWARRRFKGVLDPLAGALVRLGLTPTAVTLLGLAGNALAAVILAQGYMTVGGLIVLLMAPMDALDGTMARLTGHTSKLGAFTDSVTDRWSELFIFMGLLYFYLGQGDRLACLLIFAGAGGSLMVSYTKSRAETLGFDCNVGLLTRLERFLVLGPGLLLNLPWLAVAIIAVLANFTALQRAWYVRDQAKGK
jgi:CDP-diacylglycerol---glycerol-3-phosphate 3-phosphatidyltransferase